MKYPLFGFWLPFLGWRVRDMGVDEAWQFDQQGAGRYEVFEFQWLWVGMIFAYRPEQRK
ncbi:MAG TPA: hypothetical protein VJ323_08170 [Bryobacteraceae bacterium]|jgi:hypothetical protein|nr:hypothetical protein [Bryobacteraceae bacterium]